MARERWGPVLLVALVTGCQGDGGKTSAQNDPLLGARLGTPVASRSVAPATQVAAVPAAQPAVQPGTVPALPSPTPPANMTALATGNLPPADTNADLRIGNAGATL